MKNVLFDKWNFEIIFLEKKHGLLQAYYIALGNKPSINILL
jgi:hypothetical protein